MFCKAEAVLIFYASALPIALAGCIMFLKHAISHNSGPLLLLLPYPCIKVGKHRAEIKA